MLTAIRLQDFKGFRDETLRLGPFTILVGSNATGKSNIRDALRFLHGVARGYTLAEIIGGRFGAGGQQEWEPIRGGPHEVIRIESQSGGISRPPVPAFGVQVEMMIDDTEYVYIIEATKGFSKTNQFRITYESLQSDSQLVYERRRSTPDDRRVYFSEHLNNDTIQSQSITDGHRSTSSVKVDLDRPVLPQMKEDRNPRFLRLAVDPVINALLKCKFLNLSPRSMRTPSFPGHSLGGHGENLSSVLKDFCSDKQRMSTLMSWISGLTSMDLCGIEFRSDSSERVNFMLQESTGRLLSVSSISDGALRFLAMAVTLLGDKESRLYVFEDIGNGIYPARLHLLADLFERNTCNSNKQVLATTHSGDLLNMVNDRTFEDISVACRLEGSDTAIIRSITDLPNVRKLRTSHGLGRLLSGGWMETTLDFMDDRAD